MSIALEIGFGIVFVVDQDLPAVGVVSIHFSTVPVVIEQTVDVADIALDQFGCAILPLEDFAFVVEQVARVGEFDLVVPGGTEVECDLVMLKDWKTALPPLLSAPPP